MSNEFSDDEILKDNDEIIEDIAPFDTSSIVVLGGKLPQKQYGLKVDKSLTLKAVSNEKK